MLRAGIGGKRLGSGHWALGAGRTSREWMAGRSVWEETLGSQVAVPGGGEGREGGKQTGYFCVVRLVENRFGG